jgi:AraC-like DNA-binding protein
LGAFHVTRATTLAAYVRLLAKIGAPVEAGLRRARLPVLFDERPGAWISYAKLRAFIADMARREGLPDLGLHADNAGMPYAPLFNPVLRAPTLNRAIQVLSATISHHNSGIRVWLASAGDQARLCVGMPLPRDVPGHEISETRSLRLCHWIVRTFSGSDFEPTRVLLTARRRDLRFDVDSAYRGVRVLTDQAYGAIEFPRRLLWTEGRARIAHARQTGQSGSLGAPPKSLVEALTACLDPYLPTGYPPIDLAADISGHTVRTLQRRLAEEGTTYSEVVDNARCQAAMLQLKESDISLAQLAIQLGFSEHSAFTRAFRRWAGTTPAGYRARAAYESSADRRDRVAT